jgi:hypothetical protein
MAKVEMDLAELKALEKSIENLEKEKQTLIDNQHQVIVYHKYFNGKLKLGEKRLFDQSRVNIQAIKWNNYETQSQFIMENDVSFQGLLDKGLIEIDLSEISSKTSKDYVNMSEIIDQIRKEEEEKLQSQLKNLKERSLAAEVSLETSKEDSKKEILRIRKAYQEKEEELINTFNNKIDNLTKELTLKHDKLILTKDILLKEADLKYNILKEQFDDFKADKKRLSLEEQILELQELLKAEKAKGFWSKLFN